jgi:hypothetical protein
MAHLRPSGFVEPNPRSGLNPCASAPSSLVYKVPVDLECPNSSSIIHRMSLLAESVRTVAMDEHPQAKKALR